MRRIATITVLVSSALALPAPAGNSGIWVPAFSVSELAVEHGKLDPTRIEIRARGFGPDGGPAGPRLEVVREATGDAGHLHLRLVFDVKRHGLRLEGRYHELPRIDGTAHLSFQPDGFRYRRVTVIARDNKITVAVPADLSGR